MGTISTLSNDCHTIRIGNARFKDSASLPFRVWFSVLWSMIVRKVQQRRSIVHMSQLTEDQLRDVGITRVQVDHEMRKAYPFWYFERPYSRQDHWR